MRSYQEAVEKLGTRNRRKLENNTYLERRNETMIAVRLHRTDVVTYHADRRIVLNDGGWRTVTTKDRINTYSPVSVYQRSHVWYLSRYDVVSYQHVELGWYHAGVTILNGDVVNRELENHPIRTARVVTGWHRMELQAAEVTI